MTDNERYLRMKKKKEMEKEWEKELDRICSSGEIDVILDKCDKEIRKKPVNVDIKISSKLVSPEILQFDYCDEITELTTSNGI